MRYQILDLGPVAAFPRHIVIDRGNDEFTSFPAEAGNPNYDSFLESQSLTDAEVQARDPDVWHDMA